MPLECLATTDRQTSPARVEDHRSHLDCGAQFRLALPQSALKQGLRVRRAELRNAYRNCLNPPFAQPPCSDMSDFSNTLLLFSAFEGTGSHDFVASMRWHAGWRRSLGFLE